MFCIFLNLRLENAENKRKTKAERALQNQPSCGNWDTDDLRKSVLRARSYTTMESSNVSKFLANSIARSIFSVQS